MDPAAQHRVDGVVVAPDMVGPGWVQAGEESGAGLSGAVSDCLAGEPATSGGDSAVVQGDAAAGDGELIGVSSDAFAQTAVAESSVDGSESEAARTCVAAAVAAFLGGDLAASSLEVVDYPTEAVQSQGLVGTVSVSRAGAAVGAVVTVLFVRTDGVVSTVVDVAAGNPPDASTFGDVLDQVITEQGA